MKGRGIALLLCAVLVIQPIQTVKAADLPQKEQQEVVESEEIENETSEASTDESDAEVKEGTAEEVAGEEKTGEEQPENEQRKSVEEVVEEDTEKPILYGDTFTSDKTEAEVGDVINFSIKVTDNIGISEVVLSFQNLDNNQDFLEYMHYNSETDRYEFSLDVKPTMVAGHWRIRWVGAYDTSDNTSYIHCGREYGEDVGNFVIKNDAIDSEKPQIDKNSLKIDKYEAVVGEKITISIRATDNVGIDRICIKIYNQTTGKDISDVMKYKSSTDSYEYTLQASQDLVGRWYISYIFAYDAQENWDMYSNGFSLNDSIWFSIREKEEGFDYDCEVVELKCQANETPEFSYTYGRNNYVNMRIFDRSVVDAVIQKTTMTPTEYIKGGVFIPHGEGKTTVEFYNSKTDEIVKVYKIEVVPSEYTMCIDGKIEVSFLSTQDQTYTAVDENGTEVPMQLTGQQSSTINGKGQYSKTYRMSFSELGNKKIYVNGEQDKRKVPINVSVLDHDFAEEWTTDKEPTCTEAGNKSHHCSRCEEKKDITPIPVTEHIWDEGKITQEPDCSEEGSKEYTCTVCGQTKQEKLEALGHDFELEWATDKEPTCKEEGSKSHHCSRCGEKKDITPIPVIEHTWDEGKVTQEPGCSEEGSKEYTCTVCGQTKQEKLEELGHDFADEWTIDKEPTCTKEGSKSHHCSRCGEKKDITPIPVIEHTWDEGKVTQEPGCSEEGSKEYTCTVCGQTKQEKLEELGHDFADEWTIDKEPTCGVEGRKSIHCKVCGQVKENSEEVIPATGRHTYGAWHTIKVPTLEEKGVKQHECEVCGAVEKEDIPKLTGSWKIDNAGWWYALSDGTYLKDCRADIAGQTYFFNSRGYMITGWNWESDAWYYYNGSGAMATGWQYIGSRWYWLDSTGKMLTGKQKIGNRTYYFAGSGNMVTGWNLESGDWYYYDGSGAMTTGWQYIGGRWYYMEEAGKMLIGRQKIGNRTYCFAGSGAMMIGWNWESDAWYYYNGSGAMTTGWQYIGEAWYYLDLKDGTMYANKWLDDKYYLQGSGVMAVGWLSIGGKYYYFQANGVKACEQWIGNYYVKADGTMAADERVDNDRYYVDATGQWVPGK